MRISRPSALLLLTCSVFFSLSLHSTNIRSLPTDASIRIFIFQSLYPRSMEEIWNAYMWTKQKLANEPKIAFFFFILINGFSTDYRIYFASFSIGSRFPFSFFRKVVVIFFILANGISGCSIVRPLRLIQIQFCTIWPFVAAEAFKKVFDSFFIKWKQ